MRTRWEQPWRWGASGTVGAEARSPLEEVGALLVVIQNYLPQQFPSLSGLPPAGVLAVQQGRRASRPGRASREARRATRTAAALGGRAEALLPRRGERPAWLATSLDQPGVRDDTRTFVLFSCLSPFPVPTQAPRILPAPLLRRARQAGRC